MLMHGLRQMIVFVSTNYREGIRHLASDQAKRLPDGEAAAIGTCRRTVPARRRILVMIAGQLTVVSGLLDHTCLRLRLQEAASIVSSTGSYALPQQTNLTNAKCQTRRKTPPGYANPACASAALRP